MADHRGRAVGYIALAAAGSIWGTGFVFGKWALEELSVAHMVLLRFVFASAALGIALAYEQRGRRLTIRREDIPLLGVAAVVGVPIQYLVQFGGLARTTVSHASLMVGVLPVMLGAAAALFSRERLDAVGWTGLVASTAGAALVAFGAADNPGAATLLGDALVVASLVAGVVWILTSQRLMARGYSPVATTALVTIAGTVVLAAWVLATAGMPRLSNLSLETWLSVAAMGVLATALAAILWNFGLARVPASQAGVFLNLEPVVGAILGVLLFRDAFGVFSILGGALIIVAAVVVSRRNPVAG